MKLLTITLLTLCSVTFWSGEASGQTPTITSVSVDSAATDNASFRLLINTNPPSWIMLKYGTASGVYPYNTKSIQGSTVALAVGGLAPNTKYYVLATARPNPNDDQNICASPACGAVEITVTTADSTNALLPKPPAVWNPTHPNTGGYTVVPINVQNRTTGECGAMQNVTSPDGWTVNMGDLIPAILSKITYGTVLEFDQGIGCNVPSEAPGFRGYTLPHKSLDPHAAGDINSPNHRYIVFRTKALNAWDFTPVGVRTGPQWSSKMAKFYVMNPTPKDIAVGQVFDANNNGDAVHHMWWENLEFAPSPGYSNPPDSVDPVAFQYFFRLGSQYQSSNNSYVVLDRLYMHGWPPPFRQYTGIELGGNYQGMIGCYLSNVHTWRLTAWPMYTGTLNPARTSLSIPQNNYRFQATSPMLGMSGPAAVSVSGNVSGSIIGNLYKDRLEVQYSAPAGSVTCSGCVATQTSLPATPATALQIFTASLVSGQLAGLNWNTNCETCTSQYFMAAGVMWSDVKSNGGPYLMDNNFIDGVGEGVYVDPLYSNFAHDDLTYTRNHNIWPKNFFVNDPGWTAQGWRFNVRQHWEMKRGHRYLIAGNIFSYSWSYQNDGPNIFLSGRPAYTDQALNSGITDVAIRSNIIRHGRTGMGCMGVSPIDNSSQHSDPQVTSRVLMSNNLMYDLGRDLYCDTQNCPGFDSPYFVIRPGCQNITIKNNTGGIMKGDIPAWLYLGGGNILPNFLDFENNILYLSMGASIGSPNILWGGIVGDWPGPSAGYTGHDVTPGVSYSFNTDASFLSPPPFKSMLDNTFVHIGASVQTGVYVWKNNIGIGGYVGAPGQTADMTNAQLAALVRAMPPGDQFPIGNSIAAREKAIRFVDAPHFDYRLDGVSPSTPGGRGVDYQQLYAETGMVTGIQPVMKNPTGAQLQYQAPDARSCSIDISADGVNWTRTADAGGGLPRTVKITGLIPSTNYRYKILCYFEQQNDGVLYTEYTADQLTNGAFTTPVAGDGSVVVQFAAPAIPGVTHTEVLMTPVNGASFSRTCLTSPCSFTAPIGDYSFTTRHLNSANSVVASGTPKAISVR